MSIRCAIAFAQEDVVALLLSDNDRIILRHIMATPKYQCNSYHIAEALDMSQQTVIHHLKRLRDKGYIYVDGVYKGKRVHLAAKELYESVPSK